MNQYPKHKTMNKEELLARLKGIEWDDFEVKASRTELSKDVWSTVSAFSNTSGGWLVLGVEQKGKTFHVQGGDNAEKIESDFLNIIRSGQKLNHVLSVRPIKYDVDGAIVLAFYIPSSEAKPIYVNSVRNTYIRTGSGDRLATESELSAMYREQSFGVRSEMSITDSSMDLLDMPSLRSFRAQVAQHNPSYVPQNMSMEDFCYQIGAMNRKGELTYGGLLMLGQRKHIDHEVPTFWMDYIEVPGRNVEEAPTRYTFRIEPQENLWQYYRALLPRLRLFCDNAFHLNADGVAVDDLSQFECMRECLANACMHTDHFSPLHSCIRAYTNRIEFLNAGSFAVPLQTGEQSYQMISRPRNPSIAKMFRLAGLSENVGFGMKKILRWKELTGKDVEITSAMDYSLVTFTLGKATNVGKEHLKKLPEKTTRKNYPKRPSLFARYCWKQ